MTRTSPHDTPRPAPGRAPAATPLASAPPAAAHPAPAPAARGRAAAVRRIAFAVAVLACVPYLALKIAWIAGSELGIPAGSELLEPDRVGMMRAVNSLTVLMDSAVIGLALLLTRPWGMRVPAWLLACPLWIATGLLAPITVGFPLQAVSGLVAAEGRSVEETGDFLEPWVFTVVYGGFTLQALALGALFVPYARERWGHLWQGRDGGAATPGLPALRATAVAATGVALLPLTFQALWTAGSATGLNERLAEGRGRDFSLAQASNGLFTVLAVTGVLLLAFRVGRARSLRVPLALAWTGSSALAAWGGWYLLTSLGADEAAARPTAVMSLVYAAQVIAGMLIATAGAHFLAERDAAAGSATAGDATAGGATASGAAPRRAP